MSRAGLARIGLLIALVAIIEALCRSGLISQDVLLPPTEMFTALVNILGEGTYDAAIASTLGNVACASVIACFLGGVFGTAIHALPRLRTALDPLLSSFYAVPTFLFYPLLIVFFGVGRASIIGIAVIMSIVVMMLATLDGLDSVPRALRRTAAVYGLGPTTTALHVTLPAAMPYLFTGFKLTVAYSFIGVLASEFIMSGKGLGYEISNAYNMFENRTMYGLMLLVIVVVTFVNGILHVWDEALQIRRRR